MANKQVVIVVGAGPGLGKACVEYFAEKGHPVALLSRSLERLEELSNTVNKQVNDVKRTRPYAIDVTKKEEVEKVFKEIKNDFPSCQIRTIIYNAGGRFLIKPFLESTEEDYRNGFEAQCIGAMHVAQTFIRSLQETKEWNAWEKGEQQSEAVGNLLFSGATAAMRGSAKLSTFACSSFALRALFQSIAREFGPKGIHCSHFIIDGLIDTPRSQEKFGAEFDYATRFDPKEIAKIYYDVTQQKASVWSFEQDLRPAKEKW